MKKTTLLAIAVSTIVSTGALAARIPYAALQLPNNVTCNSNVSGACADNVSSPYYAANGISYYDTVSHQYVASGTDSSQQLNLHFINNTATIVTCTSNTSSGNSQPEPMSYCQNPQNYYDLSSETLTYHPDSQYITGVGSDYYTFDNNGPTGWIKVTVSGLIFAPSNAL